jgi:hypothetical protein
LLTYYLTMPQWVREHNAITNTFYALEYHQTRTSIRQKELALNFVASFLRPIEGKLLDVIKDVAAAKKLRLNVELGKKMLSEVRFWEFDYTELGEMTGDEEREGGKKQHGVDIDEDDESYSVAEKIFAKMNDTYREKERLMIMDKEQEITDY